MSTNISASGPLWDKATWRLRALRDLVAGREGGVRPAAFGAPLMAELVRDGIYIPDFPPRPGDSIVLDTDSGPSDFTVYQIRDRTLFEENPAMGRRELWFEDAGELRWHRLSREALYRLMAGDLGTGGKPVELATGIWEIGRKRLPGRDASKVIFIEAGVPAATLELVLSRDPFKALCLLTVGKVSGYEGQAGKTVVPGTIEVGGGRFTSDVFEDLSACQPESSAETCIYLEEHPPKLLIRGEEFKLPEDRGRPTLGVLYLAHLFENPRTLVSCWDMERMVNPKLSKLASIALGSDSRMDKDALRALDESIKKANALLEAAKKDPCAAAFEIADAQSELDRLLEQKQADTGKGGKSRLLGDPDHEKARRRVRKALDAAVAFVAKQNPAIEEPLREAVGEGAEIYFNPPPDWGL